MNYRRGFQRFFLAVSIGWVTLWLYLLWPSPVWLSSMPIQHYRFVQIKGMLIPIDTLNRLTANQKAQAIKIWLAEKGNESKPVAWGMPGQPSGPPGQGQGPIELLSDEERLAIANGEKDPTAIVPVDSPERYEYDVRTLLGMSASSTVWKFAWKAWRGPIAAAFVPPIVFYLVFFCVGRWILRGFKDAPRTQSAGS